MKIENPARANHNEGQVTINSISKSIVTITIITMRENPKAATVSDVDQLSFDLISPTSVNKLPIIILSLRTVTRLMEGKYLSAVGRVEMRH